MNREADKVIRATAPVHAKLKRQWLMLSADLADLGVTVTWSEMLGAMQDQTVYEHLLAELRKRYIEAGGHDRDGGQHQAERDSGYGKVQGG